MAIDVIGGGEPLALVHGVGSDRTVWRWAAPLLARGRRLLVADLPGFGESAPVPGEFALDTAAGTLGRALERRAHGPFDLVGNSLGGAIALVLADRWPELVRRLVLVAPAGLSPRPALAPLAGRLTRPAMRLRRSIGAPLAGSEVVRSALLAGTVADPVKLPAERAHGMFLASRGAASAGPAVAAVLRADLRPELGRLRVPVGVIWGERDRLIPIAGLDAVLPQLGDAPVERIADTGHVPHVERPEEFAAALERVLAALG